MGSYQAGTLEGGQSRPRTAPLPLYESYQSHILGVLTTHLGVSLIGCGEMDKKRFVSGN